MDVLSPRQVRRIILEESRRAGVGHIGSALSVADIVAVLFSGVLRVPSPRAQERDRFVLGKGHAALALYAALHLRGLVSREALQTYCADGSLLGTHPERALEGVDFCTGSLGHGLPMAVGAALAARLDGSPRRVFALLSDAEVNEGSVWEAAMFAAHHRLARLVAIVDVNGQQALGFTEDVLSTSPLSARWAAFGWRVHEVDGHDPAALRRCLEGLDTADGPPHAVLARTSSGKGVSFMERQVKWHYLPMDDAQFAAAMREVDEAP